MLWAEGIDVLLDTSVSRVEGRSGQSVRLAVRTPAGERALDASDILIAVGRTPNTSGIGLDRAGVALDFSRLCRRQRPPRDERADVWAIGECAGSPQFTHASLDDFRVIPDNLAGGARSTSNRLIPYRIACSPIRNWPGSV